MTTEENLFEYRLNVLCGMARHGCVWRVGAWQILPCTVQCAHSWKTQHHWNKAMQSHNWAILWQNKLFNKCKTGLIAQCKSHFVFIMLVRLLARVLNPFFWHIVCWLLWLDAFILNSSTMNSLLLRLVFFFFFCCFVPKPAERYRRETQQISNTKKNIQLFCYNHLGFVISLL